MHTKIPCSFNTCINGENALEHLKFNPCQECKVDIEMSQECTTSEDVSDISKLLLVNLKAARALKMQHTASSFASNVLMATTRK